MTSRHFVVMTLCAVLGMAGILAAPPSLWGSFLSVHLLTLHLLMELVAVWVATLVVVVSWCAFGRDDRRAAQTLIAGFMVVAVSDLMHAFTFAGMPPLFGEASVERSIFFWLTGRIAEVVSLGMVACALAPRLSHVQALLSGAAVAGCVLWLGGPGLHLVPQTFVPGVGLTAFKVGLEAVLALGNFAVAMVLWRSPSGNHLRSNRLMALSCVFMGLASFAFASYDAPSDFQNFSGHIYKVVAYLLLYQAIFIRSLHAPYEVLERSEAELRASRARLAAMDINLPGTAVFQLVKHPDGSKRFTDVSAGVVHVLKVDPAAILADPELPDRMIHPDDRALLHAAEKQSEESMQPAEMELRYILPDARTRVMRLAAAPRRNAQGEILWDGILTDITERHDAERQRRLMEMQLLQAQKMESIGMLASGIAHDFNNLLVVMMGNARLALADAKKGANDQALESIEQVLKAGTRAQGVVQRIMSFTRQDMPRRTLRPIEPVLAESMAFLRSGLPEHVGLAVDILAPNACAEVDEVQLQQVLLNLGNNAVQAIGPNAGQIGVSLDEVHLDAATALPQGLLPGRHVRIRVVDDGCGMDEETQRRVFDPFFTTKPPGQGTGLGLAMVHGIVQSHRGAVRASSKVGQGTQFDIYLPVPASDLHGADLTRRSMRSGSPDTSRVFYIDDDAVMGTLVSKLLTAYGIDVVTSTDPAAALGRLRQDPGGFGLVITDYNMPVHSGLDVAAELGRLRPDLPCILISGHVSETLRVKARALNVCEVVPKDRALEGMAELVLRTLAHPAT